MGPVRIPFWLYKSQRVGSNHLTYDESPITHVESAVPINFIFLIPIVVDSG